MYACSGLRANQTKEVLKIDLKIDPKID